MARDYTERTPRRKRRIRKPRNQFQSLEKTAP
jgi:hypothetical protein